MKLVSEFTKPEHLGEPFLGTWYVPDIIPAELAVEVQDEIYSSNLIEDIRMTSSGSINQIFRRLVVDLTKEHDFPRVQELGQLLGSFAVDETIKLFPTTKDFTLDEAATQIYPAGTPLPLGWHFDNAADGLLVISATIAGSGEVSFTNKKRIKNVNPSDVVARINVQPLSALIIRANGLYELSSGDDIRVAHAVTRVGQEDRFTIQFRQGVNSGQYGNIPVNEGRKYRGGLHFD